jgi:hypothetical protein
MGNAPIVFGAQAGPGFPEGSALGTRKTCNQQIKMRMPAGADVELGLAIRQTPMDHGQQDFFAARLKLEGHVAATLPGDDEPTKRYPFNDPKNRS